MERPIEQHGKFLHETLFYSLSQVCCGFYEKLASRFIACDFVLFSGCPPRSYIFLSCKMLPKQRRGGGGIPWAVMDMQ